MVFSLKNTTRPQSSRPIISLSTVQVQCHEDHGSPQVCGCDLGSRPQPCVYTSILRLGLAARDTPDAPITTSRPEDRAAHLKSRHTPPRSGITRRHVSRSGVLPEVSPPGRDVARGQCLDVGKNPAWICFPYLKNPRHQGEAQSIPQSSDVPEFLDVVVFARRLSSPKVPTCVTKIGCHPRISYEELGRWPEDSRLVREYLPRTLSQRKRIPRITDDIRQDILFHRLSPSINTRYPARRSTIQSQSPDVLELLDVVVFARRLR
ncbi:hypothetical protein F511_15583 [Dorcoceras hygrometricum]|uniref:Uncharacterized protein n=1 Tax=Dorcoceras hygrometricum TaxID=472368 RepID=A0A2Z7B3Q5_9LAMI|nr:hypothetical protein F511_15583 [Dorcoceras hygrometricum]